MPCSWGGDHHRWVPSPTTREDPLGGDFTPVGMTRNPSLSPGNPSKQHFVETCSLLPKKKKKVLVLPS